MKRQNSRTMHKRPPSAAVWQRATYTALPALHRKSRCLPSAGAGAFYRQNSLSSWQRRWSLHKTGRSACLSARYSCLAARNTGQDKGQTAPPLPSKIQKTENMGCCAAADACGSFQTSSTPIPFSRKADTYFSSSSLPVMTISNFSNGATCMNA